MHLRFAVLLSCAIAAPVAIAGGGPSASDTQQASSSFFGMLQFPLVRTLIVVVAYAVLFKLFSRWPKLERWLVGAALIALPPVATIIVGWGVYFDGHALFFYSAIFWVVIALALAVAWWLLKKRTRLLDSPATSVGNVQPAASASLKRATAGVPPAEPPARARPPQSPEIKPTSKAAASARDAIFISYRRQDSPDVTGRIYDRLVQRFGREQIFKDVDSIPLGVDFRSHLGNVVGRCNFLLAVIGPQWLSASGENGRRLEDKGDFVRVEVESALARDIPVIPVLVGGASLPADAELPPSLASITFRNGIRVRPDPDFHRDMDRLIAGLEQHGHG